MDDVWLRDIESLEEISQNGEARRIFLQMAALRQAGNIGRFLSELARDPAIDDSLKGSLREVAQDAGFLHALEEYCRLTTIAH